MRPLAPRSSAGGRIVRRCAGGFRLPLLPTPSSKGPVEGGAREESVSRRRFAERWKSRWAVRVAAETIAGFLVVKRGQAASCFEVNHLQRASSSVINERQHQIRSAAEIHVHSLNRSSVFQAERNGLTVALGLAYDVFTMEEGQARFEPFNLPSVECLAPTAEQSRSIKSPRCSNRSRRAASRDPSSCSIPNPNSFITRPTVIEEDNSSSLSCIHEASR